jgi:hypothetical protein
VKFTEGVHPGGFARWGNPVGGNPRGFLRRSNRGVAPQVVAPRVFPKGHATGVHRPGPPMVVPQQWSHKSGPLRVVIRGGSPTEVPLLDFPEDFPPKGFPGWGPQKWFRRGGSLEGYPMRGPSERVP